METMEKTEGSNLSINKSKKIKTQQKKINAIVIISLKNSYGYRVFSWNRRDARATSPWRRLYVRLYNRKKTLLEMTLRHAIYTLVRTV